MADRITQVGEQVVAGGFTPKARVTQVGEQVVAGGFTPNARVTQVGVQYVVSTTNTVQQILAFVAG